MPADGLYSFYVFLNNLIQNKAAEDKSVESDLSPALNKMLAMYVQDRTKIMQAYAALADQPSKREFIRFLNYILIQNVFNEDLAGTLAGYADKSLVDSTFEQCVKKYKLQNFVDAIKINPQDSIREKTVFVINNFHLNKYDYISHLNSIKRGFKIEARPEDVVLDIGAARGDTIYYFLTQKRVRKIYGFEIDSNNFAALQHNLAELNLTNKAEIFNIGISDVCGEVDISFSKSDICYEIIENPDAYLNKYKSSVIKKNLVCTIDEFCNSIDDSKPTFIKIDIIGAEFKAIKGALKFLKENRPTIVIGIWNIFNVYNIINLLLEQRLNYSFYFRMIGYNCEPVLYLYPQPACSDK